MGRFILGIIGGGQLGSMLSTAAKKIDIKTIVYCDDMNAPAQNFANESLPTLSNPSLQKVNHPQPDFVKVDEDSVMEDQKSKPNQDFSKKMHFVNEND